jgi:hypothetical protein
MTDAPYYTDPEWRRLYRMCRRRRIFLTRLPGGITYRLARKRGDTLLDGACFNDALAFLETIPEKPEPLAAQPPGDIPLPATFMRKV